MQTSSIARFVTAVPAQQRVRTRHAAMPATASGRQEAASRGACMLAAGAAALAISLQAGPAFAKAADYGVYFIEPKNGATVSSPVTVKFAVKGLDIKPASEGLQEGTGHHHLIVDGPKSLKSGEVIPFDETHLHYGKGQTDGSVELGPGKHRLTLQFANAVHKSYGAGYAKTIEVTVK